jgi:hypothetical protein
MRSIGVARAALVAIGLGAVMSACGTGRTMVMEPPAHRQGFTAISIVRAEDTVVVPDEYRVRFLDQLRSRLYGTSEKPGTFTEGQGLTARIKVVQFNAGNQFSRWFWGGIGNAGEGSLQVLAEFYDGDTKLAQIQTEGRIGSGFFGGSMDEAVGKAAEEIANYAIANFR